MAEKERQVSEITKFVEATPTMGLDTGRPSPGEDNKSRGAYVPDLGYLDEFPTVAQLDAEPVGPAFVVLADIFSTPDGTGRGKGKIVRLSEFEPSFVLEEKDPKAKEAKMDRIKASVRRHIENGHIRVADEEEAQLDQIEINPANESPEVRRERERRMEMERKLRAAGIDPDADDSEEAKTEELIDNDEE